MTTSALDLPAPNDPTVQEIAGPAVRHRSVAVTVGEGEGAVQVGGGAPIVVQSMTNTDTADIDGPGRQAAKPARPGWELARVPVGFKAKRDTQFATIVEKALQYGKTVRIGANWGSLDQELLTHLMDENAKLEKPKDMGAVTREAMLQSALLSAQRAEEIGLAKDRIILSAKVSAVQQLISVYKMLAARSDYALHLGLTEAGMGSKGIVASSAALGILLQQGIGDTIRVSLTPEPGGDRTVEVKVAQEILQTMGFRTFVPQVAACPGCGRTTSTVFQELARDIQDDIVRSMPEWKTRYPGVEMLNVAVMGCIVNGPGESKHADIGISLPGTGETPAAPIFIDGKKAMTLRGANIAAEFKTLVEEYIERRFGAGANKAAE